MANWFEDMRKTLAAAIISRRTALRRATGTLTGTALASLAPGAAIAFSQASSPTMASTYYIDIRQPPYNARGDGVHDDTDALRRAIRDASDTSKHSTGARVYVPPGRYVMFRDSTDAIKIESSNITIFGDGPPSTIFIPKWHFSFTAADQAYFLIAGDDGKAIENIHIQNLRVQSVYNDTAVLNPPPNSIGVRTLFQIGTASLTEVVHNSGFTDILVEHLGGCAFAFNGGDNDPASGNQSMNNYVIRNTIRNCAFTAINPFSGGHMNTIISDNFIDGNATFGIEWSSPYALITNNIIRRTRSSAIAFEHAANQEGWTIFANNNILECGNELEGTSVSPAIQIGESFGGRHIMIVNNVIRRAFGPGIVIAGSQSPDASDILIQGNIIDEFGVDGVGKTSPLGWIGINTIERNRVIVTNNVVRAGSGANDKCDEGIATAGGNGIDNWTDGNITLGKFAIVPILTTQSAGIAPPSAGTRDRIGLNYDITSGRLTPGYDYTNSPYIPVLPPGPNPPVDGSNIWRLFQPASTTITDFKGGYVGQTITILFYDANTVISQMGNIRLGQGSFQSSPNSSLTLIFDGSHWIETARA